MQWNQTNSKFVDVHNDRQDSGNKTHDFLENIGGKFTKFGLSVCPYTCYVVKICLYNARNFFFLNTVKIIIIIKTIIMTGDFWPIKLSWLIF